MKKKAMLFLYCFLLMPIIVAEDDMHSTFMSITQPIQTTMNIVQNGLWITILLHMHSYLAEKERLADIEEYIMPVLTEEQDQEEEDDQ